MKEFGREVDGARQARDDMQVTFQEKLKNQETYILRLKEALARSERSRRSAEAERDELQDEISKGTTEKSVLLDGLLRMEARITCSQLEDEKSRKALELLHMEHTSENAFLTSENAFLTSVNAFLKEQLDMETKKLNTVNLAKRRLENKQNEIARGREAARRPVEGAEGNDDDDYEADRTNDTTQA